MLLMEFEHSIHLGSDVLRRTVLVDRAIGSLWIVREVFVLAPHQRYVDVTAERVQGGCRRFVLEQYGMHFLDHAGGERPIPFNKIEDTLHNRLMCLNDSCHLFGIFVRRVVGDQTCVNPTLDKKQRDSPI